MDRTQYAEYIGFLETLSNDELLSEYIKRSHELLWHGSEDNRIRFSLAEAETHRRMENW